MTAPTLMSPLAIGELVLSNRVLMAPLTRLRNTEPGDLPTALARDYYVQRASAGLIISEGVHISPTAKGYAGAPGLYDEAQVAAWRDINQAVHQAGGLMAIQLWHTGRISHTSVQPDAQAPVAPSALTAESRTTVRMADGALERVPCSAPRALETAELSDIVDDYRQATDRAVRAGFDLVEIHAAHGYLLNQFLSPEANQRTDAYGGSVENRARLLLEVVDAVCAEWTSGRVGVRISPLGVFNGLSDVGQEDMALYLARELSKRKLAYLHLSEPDWAGGPAWPEAFRQAMRAAYTGCIIGAGGYTADKARQMLEAGYLDAVAFGRDFIANPDLPKRLELGAELNKLDARTLYGGDAHGYTDYPPLPA